MTAAVSARCGRRFVLLPASLLERATDHGPVRSPDTDVKFGKDKAPDNPGLKAHAVRLKFTGLAAQRAVVEGLVDKDKLARMVQ